MERFLRSCADDRVAEYSDRFIWVRNDKDKDLAADLNIPTVPYASIFDENGKEVARGPVSDVYSMMDLFRKANIQ